MTSETSNLYLRIQRLRGKRSWKCGYALSSSQLRGCYTGKREILAERKTMDRLISEGGNKKCS
jgi:hypothetical protein